MSLPLGIALGAILRVRAWIPSTAAATALSFVVPYLAYIPTEELRTRRSAHIRPKLEEYRTEWADTSEAERQRRITRKRGGRARDPERDAARWTRRIDLLLADAEYYESRHMGWREGVVFVWAGLRGAVTLAAAQTLPLDTPNRSLLVLIAIPTPARSKFSNCVS